MVALLAMLPACLELEGLVDGAYSGAPVLSFQVDLSGTNGARPATSRVLPLIFWSNTGSTTELDFKSSEAALGRYTMELKRTLPENAYKRVINQRKEQLIGRIVLFEDLDDDGEWDRDTEKLVGGSNSHIIIFHNTPELEETRRYSLARLLGCMQSSSGEHIELISRQTARDELVTVLLAMEQNFNQDIDCDQVVDDPCLSIEQSMSAQCEELYSRDCQPQEQRLMEIMNHPAFEDFGHEDFDRLQEELNEANEELTQCYEELYPNDGSECEHMDQELCMKMAMTCPEGYLLDTNDYECVCEDTSDRDPMSGECISGK